MLDGVVSRAHDVFNNKTLRSLWLRLRYPLFLLAIIVLLRHIKSAWFLPGLIVCLLGELIQLWCFAALDKNKTLAMKGPYTLTRNPMYLGRFFLLLGCLLLTGSIWLVCLYAVLYYFYMVNRVQREERKLRQVFGKAYEDYCRKVNRFLPSIKGVAWESLWFFKWNLLLKNNGHWNLAAVTLSFVVFYFFAFVY
ncbi:MAG: isoprenylcysteine carboxylmethyltransferase family protein [Thermodesulfobacteriota bacterium]|nr:isoprenylcysteine carboxylmethyltransferase family protein [Thermodesulfobacteriota bacterium]